MPITKSFLEEQQAALTRQRDQHIASVQQISGALEMVSALLKKIEEPIPAEPA